MKICIDKILSNSPHAIVTFTAEFGKSKACWSGETPKENCEYHVEVDIQEGLEWGKDIVENDEKNYSINFKDDTVYIAGVLESVDNDGYSVLRRGDYIIPFMAIGDKFATNTFILLAIKTIYLSPFHY